MFRSKKHNIVTEELNKTALNANNGKRMKSMDYKETCICIQNKQKYDVLLCKTEEIKYENAIK